jgi:hypothetical protein
LPQGIQRLLADPNTAPLVTGLLKLGGGIARLGDAAWLSVSAPLSLRLKLRGMLACLAEHREPARRRNDELRCEEGTEK